MAFGPAKARNIGSFHLLGTAIPASPARVCQEMRGLGKIKNRALSNSPFCVSAEPLLSSRRGSMAKIVNYLSTRGSIVNKTQPTARRRNRATGQRQITPLYPQFIMSTINDQNEEITNDDRRYRGSLFSEVRDAIFHQPYQSPWGAPGQPGMPKYAASLRRFAQVSCPLISPSALGRPPRARSMPFLIYAGGLMGKDFGDWSIRMEFA